jgi:hypothetical protein
MKQLKRFLLLVLMFAATVQVIWAQPDSAAIKQKDTGRIVKPTIAKPKRIIDSAKLIRMADSLRNDSLVKAFRTDSLYKDSIRIATIKNNLLRDSLERYAYDRLYTHRYLPLQAPAISRVIKERQREDKDELFYILMAALFYFAAIRLAFPKYFQNIFKLFFQPSFRQSQTREQLLQNNLPSLLFNLFFIVATSLYTAFIFDRYNVMPLSFWTIWFYAAITITLLYGFKYLFLVFSGWVFNVKAATDTYIFIIYLINKIVGVLLIPFLFILAFSTDQIVSIAVTVSLVIIGLLFLYRYILSYTPIRKDIKVSPLHFSLYLLGFEIVPLLLIYRLLVDFIKQTL